MTVRSKLTDLRLEHSFRRDPRGGIEQAQFSALSDLVSNVNLLPISDKWSWTLNGSGEFSVASIRREIDNKRLAVVSSKTQWIKSVPIKVNIIAWKVKLDALPTRLNISRRGIDINSILCPICDSGVESSNHLFFMCNLALQLYRKISHWLLSLRLQSKFKDILDCIFYVMWWHLWTFRNKLLFEAKNPTKGIIFDDIFSRSFYWCKYRCKASFSWNDWLKSPYLVTL